MVETLTGHVNWVFDLAFHPGGARLASASGDGTVRLWNLKGGQEVLALHGHRARVHGVAFSPDGTSLASVSGDGVVRIWETDLPSPALGQSTLPQAGEAR